MILREPIALALGHFEEGVIHFKRRQNVLLDVLIKSLTRNALDDQPRHVHRYRVVVTFARLGPEGQLGQLCHKFIKVSC